MRTMFSFPDADNGEGEDGLLRVVDSIPPDCGQHLPISHKRRRTTMTDQTLPLSEVESDELSEISVLAISEDYSFGENSESSHLIPDATDISSTTSLRDVSLDLSVEKLLFQSSSHSTSSHHQHLVSLFEENQKALQSLLSTTEDDLEEFHSCVEAEEKTSCSSPWNLKAACEFEVQQSLPGIGALILYCVAHVSTYEVVTNLVYQVVYAQGDDPTDAKTRVFVVILALGCLLARFSGLVWEFVCNKAYSRVKWIYHNRLWCGAMDAKALYWLQDKEPLGEFSVGCLQTIAYFMCYIAVTHFVSALAVHFDQRDEIISQLPSTLYGQALKGMAKNTVLLTCPALDHSPNALFGSSNQTPPPFSWDPLACHDYSHADEMEAFGPEDDFFLYGHLSRNSYEHFFGIGYEAPLFDSLHYMRFYAALAMTTIVTLKVCFKFSFWAGW
jgi:hypothetical protein